MTRYLLTACMLGLLIVGIKARAERIPDRGNVDARIRTAVYDEEEIYRLRGFVGYHIELIFEEGEVFTGTGGGDLEGITFGAHANHVILKPRAANVGTNLVVFTDRRAYRFDYVVTDGRPESELADVIYAVRFTYPHDAKSAGSFTSEQIDKQLRAAGRPRNFDYWFCGHGSMKPTAASDDGVHTKLTFAARSELPAVFVQNEDGSESLLNFTVQDGDVLIHRIAQRFVLRRGRLTGCVVNKAYIGTGERLDTATITPAVERYRKGTTR